MLTTETTNIAAHAMGLIEDQTALDELCRLIELESCIAIDTEFVRERTYFPHLCLIQIATPRFVACVDCLATIDLGSLFESIFRRDLTWIVHSARQDLEILWYASKRVPTSLIDTQIAAGLVGEPPQIGLQELLDRTLHVTLDKAHTRADWSRRPLPSAALEYAVDDVKHLFPLWAHLRERLTRLDRLAWFEEDCRRAIHTALLADLVTIFRRLKGAGRLGGEDVAAALALIQWREQRAQRSDRPRRWIMSDSILVEIARRRPRQLSELEAIGGLSARTVARAGKVILEALLDADSAEIRSAAVETATDRRPDPERFAELRARVAQCARTLRIEPEVIASKRDIAALALRNPPQHLATGWRAELLDRMSSVAD